MAKYSTKSCLFDGSNEYVTMGNVLDFERTDAFSFSFWFKSVTASDQYLLSKMDSVPRGYAALLESDGALAFWLHNGAFSNRLGVATTQTGFNDGNWHHAAMTYDGSSAPSGVAIYIDGIDQTTAISANDLSATISNTSPLTFSGRTSGTVWLYTGNLDEVSIHDKELSQAEVTWVYNGGLPRDLADVAAPSNLVGWWRMGDGDTYPTLLDNSVNSNNGTMTNMESGDIVEDTPGGIAAGLVDLSYPAVISSGCSTTDATISPLRTPRWVEVKVFTMRGWDPVTSSWKYWSSQFRPTRSPYSNPLAYIQIVKVSTIEVEM